MYKVRLGQQSDSRLEKSYLSNQNDIAMEGGDELMEGGNKKVEFKSRRNFYLDKDENGDDEPTSRRQMKNGYSPKVNKKENISP